ncbi:glycerophosphodiester phosphodiesterase family protein [Streptomyces sp. NPDC050803]|uniref:glycerophosphodiester phosphodiesterase n=1 Tax=unclassified Streptomyces TaxID=2593676 RepID=UPI003419163C
MSRRTLLSAAVGPLAALTLLSLGVAPHAVADSTVRSEDATAVAVIAHRGASAAAPENTLEAVDTAHDMGVRWVENDVQRTKDGELVVLHDTNLARTTDVEQVFPDRAPWNLRDFTLAEIEKLDAGSWKGAQWTGARVPTLEQYMNRVEDNHQALVLEIKAPELYPGIEKEVLRELKALGWLDSGHVRAKLVIQSFSADCIRTVHELRPDVKTGFLGKPAVADLPKYTPFADQINTWAADAAYYDAVHALTGPHRRPLQNYTWTIDDPAQAVSLAKAGADGIITNRPDAVTEALEEAGYVVP